MGPYPYERPLTRWLPADDHRRDRGHGRWFSGAGRSPNLHIVYGHEDIDLTTEA